MKKILLSTLLVAGSLVSYAQKPVAVTENPEGPEAVASTVENVQAVVDEAATARLEQMISTRADDIVGKFRSDYGTYFYGQTTADGSIYSGTTSAVTNIPGVYTYLCLPAYTDFTFRNLTEGGSSYTWYLSAANNTVQSTDKDYHYGPITGIKQDYHFSYYYSPVLSVDGGPSNGIATVMKSGHDTYIPWTNGERTYGLAAYPSSTNNGEAMVAAVRTWWTAGEDAVNQTWWTSASKLSSFGLDEGTFTGYAQMFEKPITPLVLESVSGYARANISKGAIIKATIRKINDAGQIADVITTGEYEFQEDIENIQGTSSNGITKYTIPVTALDEFQMETPLVIDYPFVVIIEADWKGGKYSNFCQLLISAADQKSFDDYYASGRFGPLGIIKGKKDGADKTVYGYTNVSFTSGNVAMAWWINLDGYFPYFGNFGGSNAINDQLEDQLGDKYELTYPTSATTYSIWVQSNYGLDDILVSDENDDEVASWLKVSSSNQVYTSGSNTYDYIDYSISAEALPSNVKGRQATVKFSSTGLTKEYIITQGEYDGVNSVTVESVTVKAVNGNFEVTAPASVSNVEVYNVAGQVVVNAPVSAGVNTIDGSALANGVYVLKFNNGY
ncbi:MAG: T9SS type A sorting domain-containing protein, partial [Muribaculaceae bacterium]|nr:T9SS type A sorting domain-containing protein [Muribaculaceae bacterium]